MGEYKPDRYTLYLKDLYNKDEAFRYYCDYYKTCKITRFMFLEDIVDFANGGEYKKHYGAYRKRCEGWVKSANDIRSYMLLLNIDVDTAFSLWYYFGWVGYESCGKTKRQLQYLIKKLNKEEQK